MMFRCINIELSGIKKIVIDQTKVYERLANNDWKQRSSDKIIPDHIMMIRVKKMLTEVTAVEIEEWDFDYYTDKFVSRIKTVDVPKYRIWVNLETINIERNLY